MKRLLTCLLLAALVTNACALEVPTNTTVQNLNGSQQFIKTYTLPPGADPQQLIEEPFEPEGYRYTSAEGMAYKDGHIGIIKIPSLKIDMKLWEGETNASMKKGLGTTVPPPPGMAGNSHTASQGIGDGYLTNGKPITEENVLELLREIEKDWPTGTVWGTRNTQK